MLLPYARSAGNVRHYLELDGAKLLATALVSSRLDCNSLLHGIVDTDLTKLQHIQN